MAEAVGILSGVATVGCAVFDIGEKAHVDPHFRGGNIINRRVSFEGAYFHYHEVVKQKSPGSRSAPWVLVNNGIPNPNAVKHFHQQFT